MVGTGLAGLVAALQASQDGRVLLVSATGSEGGSSDRAQGGIAAALDEDDAPELHGDDTLRAGRGLCAPSAVDVLVREGPGWIERLSALGVPFGSEAGLEGGHSRRRVHQVGGAQTGRAVVRVLAPLVAARPSVTLATGECVTALWMQDGRCVGARTDRRLIAARATVLATGGYAALYARTTNPLGSRGDGAVLAYRAGATLADLEFVQFHPTALVSTGMLLSEALRGEGAILLDDKDERFVDELAPRDEVARAIFQRGGARLDLRAIERDRFPALMEAIAAAGFDPAREPIPVSPAAHYTMGGIATDLRAQTSVRGLFAAGECACTGVHGANRLASNSLLECMVFGGRAGAAAVAEPALPARLDAAVPQPALDEVTPAVREMLWRCAGVVREPGVLQELAQSPHLLGRLVGEACLLRVESRGSHFRVDAPTEDPSFGGHFVFGAERPTVMERWS